MGKKIKTTPVITIPAELQDFTKNIRFAYVSLRNLFYAMHVCSVNTGVKGHDFTAQTNALLSSYIGCLNQNNSTMFKNDAEVTVFADTLTAFNRNMLNKNEHIILLLKSLSVAPGVDKHQIFMLFCHICLECSLQLNRDDELDAQLVEGVVDETCKKMLINLGNNLRQFMITEIVSVYAEV
jgi:hypothetical protein